VAWAEAYRSTKWHLDPSSRLATTDMAENWGKGCAPFGGELGPHLMNVAGADVCLHAKFHLHLSSHPKEQLKSAAAEEPSAIMANSREVKGHSTSTTSLNPI